MQNKIYFWTIIKAYIYGGLLTILVSFPLGFAAAYFTGSNFNVKALDNNYYTILLFSFIFSLIINYITAEYVVRKVPTNKKGNLLAFAFFLVLVQFGVAFFAFYYSVSVSNQIFLSQVLPMLSVSLSFAYVYFKNDLNKVI